MGLFIRKDDSRSHLQSKVVADLQERLRTRDPLERDEPEPAFTEHQHQTRPAGVVLVVIIVLALIALFWVVSQNPQ